MENKEKSKTIALKNTVFNIFKKNKRNYMDLEDFSTFSDSKFMNILNDLYLKKLKDIIFSKFTRNEKVALLYALTDHKHDCAVCQDDEKCNIRNLIEVLENETE
jgi:hypothetical protein